jgi:hypothetical protein
MKAPRTSCSRPDSRKRKRVAFERIQVMPLGFPASCLYVAIADRAIGFEMPPDIPASDLKK